MSNRYRVILADPAWRYAQFSSSVNGAAASHYDTMSDDEIAALPVASWAGRDCVLALWATWPRLDAGMRVVTAWGFEYVTAIPWVKVVPSSREIYRGIGFWAQACSEVLLIGRKGEPTRADAEQVIGLMHGEPRIFYAPRTRHSAKPPEVHEYLERLFPGGPFLELFARQERPGWDCWGNELGFKLSEKGVEPCALPEPEPMPLFDTKGAA